MSVPEKFQGWKIAEAIRRALPRELLSARATAQKAWRGAGYPSQFRYKSEYIHGRNARHHNAREAERHDIYKHVINTHNGLLEALRELLLRKRLLAWGCRESPLEPTRPIPPAAWRALDFRDLRASTLREATARKTEVFDVRIFPVIEAPNALEYLSELTLAEVFDQFVFGDPQWESLHRHARDIGNSTLEPNHRQGWYSSFWPASCGQGDWSESLFYIDPHSGPIGHLANLVVGRRFARLINYLRAGQLLAEATTANGKIVTVPRSLWSREQTHIDVLNGDLIEHRPNARERWEMYSEPIFMGVTLRKAEQVFHVKPTEHAEIRSFAAEGAGHRTSGTLPTISSANSERPRSARRRPVADDVAQALRKIGIDRDPGRHTWKQLASWIAPHLTKQPTNEQEWNALTTAVKRHFKDDSRKSKDTTSGYSSTT